jgi:hypothetical protein
MKNTTKHIAPNNFSVEYTAKRSSVISFNLVNTSDITILGIIISVIIILVVNLLGLIIIR